MAANDCAGVGKWGHAANEPDCEGGAKGDFSGEVWKGAKGSAGEYASFSIAVHAEFLLEEGVVGVTLWKRVLRLALRSWKKEDELSLFWPVLRVLGKKKH